MPESISLGAPPDLAWDGGASGVLDITREDILDDIVRSSPIGTPFSQRLSRHRATSYIHEWSIDRLTHGHPSNALASADVGVVTQRVGFDVTTMTPATPPKLMRNCIAIFAKDISAADHDRNTKYVGIDDPYVYEYEKRIQELAIDLEYYSIRNLEELCVETASPVSGREFRGLRGWLLDTDADGFGNAPDVNGADLADEFQAVNIDAGAAALDVNAHFIPALEGAWIQGAEDMFTLLTNSRQKIRVGTFEGVGVQRNTEMTARLLSYGIDMFETDFGKVEAVLDRWAPTDEMYFLNMKYWAFAVKTDARHVPLAKTGANQKGFVDFALTLVCRNPSANSIITDLSVALPTT